MKLQHEEPEQASSQVSVQYDGRTENLQLDENGQVKVDAKVKAESLAENHPKFTKVEDSEEPSHVLDGKTVDEVRQYVKDIEDVDRLLELRELEDRKTGKEAIDQRISDVKEKQPTDVEAKEVDENHEVSEENEDDGAQTEE